MCIITRGTITGTPKVITVFVLNMVLQCSYAVLKIKRSNNDNLGIIIHISSSKHIL